MNSDPYQTLGVAEDASHEEIRAAYRRLAKELDPDLNPGDRAAEEQFKAVVAAYDLLSEPENRARRAEIDELTASELDVLRADRERWRRMGAGCHLDDWLSFGPGLTIRRRLALMMGRTRSTRSRAYAVAMGSLLQRDDMHTMERETISAILWLREEDERLEILKEIRDGMTTGEQARLNSPISARQRVQKVLDARAGKKRRKRGDRPVEKPGVVDHNIALQQVIDDLKQKLDKAQGRIEEQDEELTGLRQREHQRTADFTPEHMEDDDLTTLQRKPDAANEEINRLLNEVSPIVNPESRASSEAEPGPDNQRLLRLADAMAAKVVTMDVDFLTNAVEAIRSLSAVAHEYEELRRKMSSSTVH